MLWILIPLVLFIIFGHFVRKKAERLRAEDERPHVVVSIKLAGKGMAMREELHLRNTIEDEIAKRGIGRIADAGSGEGVMWMRIAVEDAERAAFQLRELLETRGISAQCIVRSA